MRSYSVTSAVLATAAMFMGSANADLCASGSQEIGGNWYCQAVKRISYEGVGGVGSYNKITKMDSTSGSCSSDKFSYSGSMAPLDEEISWHFRGPLKLKQFAVYYPGSGSTSKAKRSAAHQRRHGHAHFHEKNKEIREIQEAAEAEKRGLGDLVVATINGEVVSWLNDYDGGSTHAATSAAAVVAAAAATTAAAAAGTTKKTTTKASATATGYASAASGDWVRSAYYNSEDGTADGIAFLNNMGGQSSGTFDYVFGNSLSYASSDAKSGCASPEVLDTQLPSNTEIAIFSDKECSGDACGYYRPGTVAHHGFDGAEKAFFLEFSMPDDGTSGWNMNMPAAWILNAQIPRTLQYGKAECSCWTTGCAEFDVFEVLDSGNTRCKSTLHGNIQGGSSDFFERPTNGFIKAAVVFHNDNIVIEVLDDDFNFGSSIAGSTIDSITADDSSILTSLFKLVS